MFISVLLPEPDAPMIGDELALLDVERHAAQRVHGLVAHLVDLDEVARRHEHAARVLSARRASLGKGGVRSGGPDLHQNGPRPPRCGPPGGGVLAPPPR